MSYVPLGKPLLPLISPGKATRTATFLLAAEVAVALPLGNSLLWLYFPWDSQCDSCCTLLPWGKSAVMIAYLDIAAPGIFLME